MSLDFGAPGSQAPHGMYGQELDQSFNGGDHTSNHNLGGTLPANGFDHGDGMEVSESPNYICFPTHLPTHLHPSVTARTRLPPHLLARTMAWAVTLSTRIRLMTLCPLSTVATRTTWVTVYRPPMAAGRYPL